MKQKYSQLILSALLAMYCLYYAGSLDSWHFIDNVNLVIHEAGHVVFSPLGTFLHIAGGSLLQLIMPALFVGYFWRTSQKYSASVIMNWLAINFFSVAHYAADAVKMQLPLLGDDPAGHDWHNLLSMTGLLSATKPIAGLIYFAGFLVVGFALYLSYQVFIEEL